MCHRMKDDLYIIGNKQFLADIMNSILFLEPSKSVPVPHYLNDDIPISSVHDTETLLAQV